jgi:hypothetical protein
MGQGERKMPKPMITGYSELLGDENSSLYAVIVEFGNFLSVLSCYHNTITFRR